MLRAKYTQKSIWTDSSLESSLSISMAEIRNIIFCRQEFYYEFPVPKSNGGTRTVGAVRDPLQSVQRKIKTIFLDHVIYPSYLYGSVRDAISPRSALTNAITHQKAKHLYTADIKSFFDKVTGTHVNAIWRSIFGFSPDISEILTLLTTLEGRLPQGTCTSPALANLVFFREEPYVVERLERVGFKYTRYVDDITLSNRSHVPKQSITHAVQEIRGMIRSQGFVLARSKQHFSSEVDSKTGNRKALRITGHTVGQVVSLPAERRRGLEVAIHKLLEIPKTETNLFEIEKSFRSIAARVGQLKRLHPSQHSRFKAKIDVVKKWLKSKTAK